MPSLWEMNTPETCDKLASIQLKGNGLSALNIEDFASHSIWFHTRDLNVMSRYAWLHIETLEPVSKIKLRDISSVNQNRKGCVFQQN